MNNLDNLSLQGSNLTSWDALSQSPPALGSPVNDPRIQGVAANIFRDQSGRSVPRLPSTRPPSVSLTSARPPFASPPFATRSGNREFRALQALALGRLRALYANGMAPSLNSDSERFRVSLYWKTVGRMLGVGSGKTVSIGGRNFFYVNCFDQADKFKQQSKQGSQMGPVISRRPVASDSNLEAAPVLLGANSVAGGGAAAVPRAVGSPPRNQRANPVDVDVHRVALMALSDKDIKEILRSKPECIIGEGGFGRVETFPSPADSNQGTFIIKRNHSREYFFQNCKEKNKEKQWQEYLRLAEKSLENEYTILRNIHEQLGGESPIGLQRPFYRFIKGAVANDSGIFEILIGVIGTRYDNDLSHDHLKPIAERKFCSPALALQILNGIRVMKKAGVFHGDIKSKNILVSKGPPVRVDIADFGFARTRETLEETWSKSRPLVERKRSAIEKMKRVWSNIQETLPQIQRDLRTAQEASKRASIAGRENWLAVVQMLETSLPNIAQAHHMFLPDMAQISENLEDFLAQRLAQEPLTSPMRAFGISRLTEIKYSLQELQTRLGPNLLPSNLTIRKALESLSRMHKNLRQKSQVLLLTLQDLQQSSEQASEQASAEFLQQAKEVLQQIRQALWKPQLNSQILRLAQDDSLHVQINLTRAQGFLYSLQRHLNATLNASRQTLNIMREISTSKQTLQGVRQVRQAQQNFEQMQQCLEQAEQNREQMQQRFEQDQQRLEQAKQSFERVMQSLQEEDQVNQNSLQRLKALSENLESLIEDYEAENTPLAREFAGWGTEGYIPEGAISREFSLIEGGASFEEWFEALMRRDLFAGAKTLKDMLQGYPLTPEQEIILERALDYQGEKSLTIEQVSDAWARTLSA